MNKCKALKTYIIITTVISVAMISGSPVNAATKNKETVKSFESFNDQEEAFTADDLKKFLEKEKKGGNSESGTGSVDKSSEQDKLNKEERWKQFMELSVNGVVSENETEEGHEDKDANKDKEADKNADKNKNTDKGKASDKDGMGSGSGEENPGQEDTEDGRRYYLPPKGEEWKLLLVNKQNPIPSDYDAKLVNINGSARIREEVALPLAEMFEAAAKDGVTLTVCSAYRSHEHQQELFDAKIRGYTRQGLSYLDAFRIGSYSVIIPGTSEHELGMALDIITPGYTQLNEGFADTKAGRWLAVNAYKYGFILRYPEGREYITGITFEPWHYRYVGKEAAQDIYDSGLTLEEYIEETGYGS